MRDAWPTRRAVLGGMLMLAAGTAACTPGDSGADKRRERDDAARSAAAAASAALLDRYAEVTLAHPGLAARLDPLAAEHRAHLDALGGAPKNAPPAAPAGPVPPTAAAALAQLADREQQSSDARLPEAAAATGTLARLLASVAACQAGHAALLRSAA